MFSINHEVSDLTERINAVYKNFDKYFVAKLINNVAKRLVRVDGSSFKQVQA